MKCYILQAGLGIGIIAVILAVSMGFIFGIGKLLEKLPSTPPKWLEWVGATLIIGLACTALAALIWITGGEALHKYFHYCVGAIL